MRLADRVVRVLLTVLVALFLVAGCASGDDDKTTKEPAEQREAPRSQDQGKAPEPETAEPKVPTMSDVAGYKQWLKMNRAPVQGRTHGLANIYINQERATIAPDGDLVFPFPDGTVIVKEILDSDLVAIMRKAEGVDPDHNDWQWIEYGSGDSVAGKDQACWGCHSDAASMDYVFTDLDSP